MFYFANTNVLIQVCQELAHLETCVNRGKEKRMQLEKMYSQLFEHAQAEMTGMDTCPSVKLVVP